MTNGVTPEQWKDAAWRTLMEMERRCEQRQATTGAIPLAWVLRLNALRVACAEAILMCPPGGRLR